MRLVYQYLFTPFMVLVVGYMLLRVAGKRAVQQMSSFDLLIVVVLGTAISEPIVTKDLRFAIWYSIAVVAIYYVLLKLTLVNRLKRILVDRPTVLVRGGDVLEPGLRTVKMTVEELLGKLRVKGFATVRDVELAVMEESGDISVIPASNARPLQPSDVGLSPKRTFIPIPLVIDAQVIEPNLRYLGIDRDGLLQVLSDHDLKDITLATYNEYGGIDIDTTALTRQVGPFNFKPGGQDPS